MDAAKAIKDALDAREVARFYGYEPNRSGFIKCPFHTEDTPSLKLYPDAGGWHCFGCGKGGSVIDFVMELFGLDFRQALVKLNADFHLGLLAGPRSREPDISPEAVRRMREQKKRREEKRKQEIQEARDTLLCRTMMEYERENRDKFDGYWRDAIDGKPVPEQFINYVKWQPYYEYLAYGE